MGVLGTKREIDIVIKSCIVKIFCRKCEEKENLENNSILKKLARHLGSQQRDRPVRNVWEEKNS